MAVPLNNLWAKLLGDSSQCRHARFNHGAGSPIRINRLNAELLKGLGYGAFATADTAGQADN